MVLVTLFSVMAVSFATMSVANVTAADKYQQANRAQFNAESGLQILSYWLSQAIPAASGTPTEGIPDLAASLQSVLASNAISNIQVSVVDSNIVFTGGSLGASNTDSFSGVFSPLADKCQLYITGSHGPFQRTVRVDYTTTENSSELFGQGLVSKGPLAMTGNVSLCGANDPNEGRAFIESYTDILALDLTGNSGISGDVQIANPMAIVSIIGNSTIGGETGQAAIDNHVQIGVSGVAFPVPDPSHFEPWATNTIDSSTNTNGNKTFENIRILAGANPRFNGNITIKGVVFVESPNVVEFCGNLTNTAIIVGDGDITDNSGTDRLIFTGNVTSNSVASLPSQSQFDGLHGEVGTFLMAPGFQVEFGGNFSTLSGGIFANGISFYGNAGGTIKGSVINYSDQLMTMNGNSDLCFDLSGCTQTPAGFSSSRKLVRQMDSYTELTL